MSDRTLEEVGTTPGGHTLFREPNGVGGHRYWSDEIGGGVMVWDTCLVGEDTLLQAIAEEIRRKMNEARNARG